MPMLEAELKPLVDEKAAVIRGWIRNGRIARVDPWHLIFSIWATTQHYADFDVQVRAVLGPDRGGGRPLRGCGTVSRAALSGRAEGQELRRRDALQNAGAALFGLTRAEFQDRAMRGGRQAGPR